MAYINNTGYPSSTEILKAHVDRRWFKQEHLDRGNAVHAMVAADLRGLIPAAKEKNISYFLSYLEFKKHIEEIFIVEERLVDEDLGYTGQPDLVAKLDGEFNNWICVIDWKTSMSRSHYWGPQVASYKNLVEKEYALPIDRCMTVRLRQPSQKGRPALHNIFSVEQTKLHWQVFTGELINYNFFGGNYGY